MAIIGEIKGSRLLQGFRGRPTAEIDALETNLVRVSHRAIHLEGRLGYAAA